MSFSFEVPERHREFLEAFSRLADDDFERLRSTLVASKQTFLSRRGLTELTSKAVNGWTETEGSTLIGALFGMLSSMLSHSVPADEFASSLSRSRSLSLNPVERDRLRDRLTALLNAPSIEGSGKAANIAAENERTFHTSRTIAQIRPVFRSDALQPPLGGVVLHQLHISAWDNEGNDHTYVVTLDTEDLDFLKRVIERALHKSESLENWLSTVGFDSFRVDPEIGTEA